MVRVGKAFISDISFVSPVFAYVQIGYDLLHVLARVATVRFGAFSVVEPEQVTAGAGLRGKGRRDVRCKGKMGNIILNVK